MDAQFGVYASTSSRPHSGKHEGRGVEKIPMVNTHVWPLVGVGDFALHRYSMGY